MTALIKSEDNIKMDLTQEWCKNHVIQDRNQRPARVNTVMNLPFAFKKFFFFYYMTN
jgi:hypothetical protein